MNEEDFDHYVRRVPTVVRGRHLNSGDAALVLNEVEGIARTLFGAILPKNTRWPAQPPSGSVLRWERTYKSSGSTAEAPVYTYVALRVGDKWYLTGRRIEIVDWDQLQSKIGDSPCFLVTEYKEIPRPAPDPRETMDPTLWFQDVFGDGAKPDDDTEDQAKA